jgi:hypothetical protein
MFKVRLDIWASGAAGGTKGRVRKSAGPSCRKTQQKTAVSLASYRAQALGTAHLMR